MASRKIMLDIETLGTSKDSVVLAIGAVEFNDTGVVKQFYVQIDPESCTDWGLRIDARTVMWWLDQNDAARKQLTSTKGKALDIALAELRAAFNWKDAEVWANGIDFDFTILEQAYKAIGHEAPWPYWAKMDYRTVKNLVPRAVFNELEEKNPVAHHALSDAMCQAATLIKLLQRIVVAEPVATAAAKPVKKVAGKK